MSTPEPPPEPPQSFQTKEAAVKWVLNSNSTHFKRATTTRSDTTRVYFKCINETCNFSFHARQGADGIFRVSEWKWHTCDPLSTARVKPAWAVSKAKDLLAKKRAMKPKEFQADLRTSLGVTVDGRVAMKVVSQARRENEAKEAAFNKLQGLFDALKAVNPGTVAEIACEGGASLWPFFARGLAREHGLTVPGSSPLTPLTVLPRTRASCLQQPPLTARGKFFPIAIGFATGETAASWRFFVENLADALNIRQMPLTIISDRCKGIDSAVSLVLPRASHSFCAFHIKQNVLQKYGTGAASFVFDIANASTVDEYKAAMNGLLSVSPAAKVYLKKLKKINWVRAFFPMPRFGHVTSNVAESINASLLECRKNPPVKLFLETVDKINSLFWERREMYYNKDPNDLVECVFVSVCKNLSDGRSLKATRTFGMVFKVQSSINENTERVVDLERRTCTCKTFEDMGFPCRHACAAAILANVEIRSLCSQERRVGSLQRTYSEGIMVVDMRNVPVQHLEPPLIKRLPGRPKERRIRSQVEDRPRKCVFCSLCGIRGQYITTCPENYA